MTQNMQTESMSTYDRIILAGKKEGKIEQALEVAKNLIAELPTFSDERIARSDRRNKGWHFGCV